MLRVATSSAMLSSRRPVTPLSSTARTSSGVLSSITSSPGRSATVGVNGGAGRDACHRRCAAVPSSPCPSATRVHQPVERRHRRQSHHPRAVLLLQQPPHPAAQPHQCARRPLPLLLQHRPDCRDHSLIGPPHRRPLPHRPAVHQPPQALAAVARPHPAHRRRTRRPARRRQLLSLRPLPLRQASYRRIELLTRGALPDRVREAGLHPRTCRCHARARSRT